MVMSILECEFQAENIRCELLSAKTLTHHLPVKTLTRFDGAVYVGSGLVVHPVESRLHRQACQHAVFGAVPVRSGNVDSASLVMQGVHCVVAFLVPSLGDPQLDAGPLVHHRDSKRVQLFFAPLEQRYVHLFSLHTWHVTSAVTLIRQNRLKAKFKLNYKQNFSSYRAVNTLRLSYKNQPVNVVQ